MIISVQIQIQIYSTLPDEPLQYGETRVVEFINGQKQRWIVAPENSLSHQNLVQVEFVFASSQSVLR